MAAAALTALAGCSSSSGFAARSAAAAFGSPLEFHFRTGQNALVTVGRVVDPATPAPYQAPVPPGDRYVGVQVTLQNESNSNMVNDLAAITSVEGSDGGSYSPAFVSLADCPAFPGVGISEVVPNGTSTGCIAVALPVGVGVREVVIGSPGLTPGIWTPEVTTAATASTETTVSPDPTPGEAAAAASGIRYTPCWNDVVEVTDASSDRKANALIGLVNRDCLTLKALNEAIFSLDPNNLTPALLSGHDQWFFEHGYTHRS